MKVLKNPVVLIMIGSIILMVVISTIFILRPKDEANLNQTSDFGKTIEIGQILCPLEGDECALSEITTKLDESFPYSTLNYYQIASQSSVFAVFDGDITSATNDAGERVIKIVNDSLRVEAMYIIKGNVVEISESVTSGQEIARIEKPEGVEVFNDALIFNLYNIDSGNKLFFEKVENKYLEIF